MSQLGKSSSAASHACKHRSFNELLARTLFASSKCLTDRVLRHALAALDDFRTTLGWLPYLRWFARANDPPRPFQNVNRVPTQSLTGAPGA